MAIKENPKFKSPALPERVFRPSFLPNLSHSVFQLFDLQLMNLLPTLQVDIKGLKG
jgi:hypothetical protein